MKKILSKKDKSRLLHLIISVDEINSRIDLSEPDEMLQVSVSKPELTFSPEAHVHLNKVLDIQNIPTQESWFIYSGAIRATYYDLDNSFLESVELNSGDLSITFAGGHSLQVMRENTVIIEHKSGPYLGRNRDKKTFTYPNDK